MSAVKQSEPGPTNKSLEMDIERNAHELSPAGAIRHDNVSDEMAAPNLALLGRVSEVSTREIENLISELRGLREKLKTDCDRINGDVAEYVELSQGVMQLTAIISDSGERTPEGTAYQLIGATRLRLLWARGFVGASRARGPGLTF